MLHSRQPFSGTCLCGEPWVADVNRCSSIQLPASTEEQAKYLAEGNCDPAVVADIARSALEKLRTLVDEINALMPSVVCSEAISERIEAALAKAQGIGD